MNFFFRTEQNGAVVPVELSEEMAELGGYVAVGSKVNGEGVFAVVPKPEPGFDVIRLRLEGATQGPSRIIVNADDSHELWQHVFGSKTNRPFYAYLADIYHLKVLGTVESICYEFMELVSMNYTPESEDRELVFAALDTSENILHTARVELKSDEHAEMKVLYGTNYTFTRAT